jgi:hypothetical protein
MHSLDCADVEWPSEKLDFGSIKTVFDSASNGPKSLVILIRPSTFLKKDDREQGEFFCSVGLVS